MATSMTNKQIQNLLKLQELLYSKFLTVELLNELVRLYTMAVEILDNAKLNLKGYFLDKIRFVLSRQEIQSMLQVSNKSIEPEKREVIQNIRQTIRMVGVEEVASYIQNPQFQKKKESPHRYNYSEEKTKEKVDMQMMVMKEMEDKVKQFKQEVNQIDIKSKTKMQEVEKITKGQDQKLKERLEKRKNRNKKRKKSFDLAQNNGEERTEIKKEELKNAKIELDEAVTRFTIRMTQKLMESAEKEEKGEKGRIKTTMREIDEGDEW